MIQTHRPSGQRAFGLRSKGKSIEESQETEALVHGGIEREI
jgi:hypothetical protein